jgi:hypothetical protein
MEMLLFIKFCKLIVNLQMKLEAYILVSFFQRTCKLFRIY